MNFLMDKGRRTKDVKDIKDLNDKGRGALCPLCPLSFKSFGSFMSFTSLSLFSALKLLLTCGVFTFLTGCSESQKGGFRVAATPVPHAQLLEFIKPDLKEKGIDLQIIVTEDYNIPNRALANEEVDANFFQHLAFMEEQINQFGYSIESLAAIEIEPMGIYSKKFSSLANLPEGSKIAIPNDPTNEARALKLLQSQGLIELDDPNNLSATVLNIKSNPKNFHFIEVDAAMLPRTLEDVAAAAINTNFALEAHLVPEKDALVLESINSPYANIIAIRIGEESRPDIQTLKEAMTSEKMKKFILKEYKGALLPAF
jgi:D-methionine transport system substrate-binding protein